jgi:hypothetical protein
MNNFIARLVALAGCIAIGILISGCGEPPPPEKSTLEKVDSTDAAEQEQGLDEAENKYGKKK